MARVLKPGGRFVLDMASPETIFPSFLHRSWTEREGAFVLNENHYDTSTGRMETDWILIKDGKTKRAHSSMRFYTHCELEQLFREVGFGDFQAFGSIEGDPFALDSRRLVFVATKAGG